MIRISDWKGARYTHVIDRRTSDLTEHDRLIRRVRILLSSQLNLSNSIIGKFPFGCFI